MAVAGVLRDVGGRLRRQDRELSGIGLGEPDGLRNRVGAPASFTDLAGVIDGNRQPGLIICVQRHAHFQRVITTRVPSPTRELK